MYDSDIEAYPLMMLCYVTCWYYGCTVLLRWMFMPPGGPEIAEVAEISSLLVYLLGIEKLTTYL